MAGCEYSEPLQTVEHQLSTFHSEHTREIHNMHIMLPPAGVEWLKKTGCQFVAILKFIIISI